MKFALKIALRFLLRAKKTKAVYLFSLITILGVMSSVFLFFMINTVLNGLTLQVQNAFLGFNSPATVFLSSQAPLEADLALELFNRKYPGVVTHKIREFDGLIQNLVGSPMTAKIRAVDQTYLVGQKQGFELYWGEGSSADTFNESSNQIIIGESLYKRLNLMPGDDELVLITHPFADLGPSGEIEPQQKHFKIVGIFHTGRFDFDDQYSLISQKGADSLANPLFLNHRLLFSPPSNVSLETLKSQWNLLIKNPKLKLQTWLDLNQGLFKAIKLESLMYMLVSSFILLIAFFNLSAVVSIFCLGQAREVAIFKSMGLRTAQIRSVFLGIGFILGTIGVTLGIGLGLVLVQFLLWSDFQMPEAYGFTKLPLSIDWFVVFAIFIGTPILAIFASMIPARRFNHDKAVQILREI